MRLCDGRLMWSAELLRNKYSRKAIKTVMRDGDSSTLHVRLKYFYVTSAGLLAENVFQRLIKSLFIRYFFSIIKIVRTHTLMRECMYAQFNCVPGIIVEWMLFGMDDILPCNSLVPSFLWNVCSFYVFLRWIS